jgi:hypothetical protein
MTFAYSTYTVTLKANNLPKFATAPANQVSNVGYSMSYKLPATSDADNDVVTLNNPRLSSNAALPSFVSFAVDTFKFYPMSSSNAGSYSVCIDLFDTLGTTTTCFSLLVNNCPSMSSMPSDCYISMSSSANLGKFSYYDSDGTTPTATLSSLPSFVT